MTVDVIPAPEGAPEAAPRIWQAIAAVMRDTTPVGKDQVNSHQRYNFRGIDDLMSAVAGPMRRHGVFILPEVVERTTERRGEKMTAVLLKMRYHIYGPAGDCLVATVPGEASDTADKATNKAMSAAFKYLLLQVLMVPIDARSIDDGDRDHPETDRAAVRRSGRAEAEEWETSPPPAPTATRPGPPPRDFLAEARAARTTEAVRAVWTAAQAAYAPQHYLDQITARGRDVRAAEESLGARQSDNRFYRELSEGDLAAAAASGHPDVEWTARAIADQREPAPARSWLPAPDAPPPTDEHLGAAAHAARSGISPAEARRAWNAAQATARPRPQSAPAPTGHDRAQAADHATALADMYAAGRDAGLTPTETEQTFAARWQHAPDRGTVAEVRAQAADLRAAAGQAGAA